MFPTIYGALTAGGGAAFTGAYDAIPNLVHVYEIARRTLTSYTGNLVRLRRASDSAELDFGPVANGDLDVAAIATWAGGDSFVVTIYDQVGSDNVTQATAGNQPLFVASGQNGRAVGRYNGTSQYLQGAFTNGGALSQPFNAYAAVSVDTIDPGTRHITDSDDSSNRLFVTQTNTFWRILAGAVLDTPADTASTAWHVLAALFAGASSQIFIDGTSLVTGNPGAQNADGITIGARFDGAANFMDGDIAPVIIADPNNDTAGRQAVEAAINSYYAIF